MIYHFLKILIQLYNRVYFKKIYVIGASHIPKKSPVFIAANHPNGFLDGTIVSGLLSKPTHIFVRGDVFTKKWSNFILRSMKLIPIFRVRDGELRQSVKMNNQSYDQLYAMFKRNVQVMIFPESDSVPVKRLRGLKKGTARIILDMSTREDGNLKVDVVPTGLNYSFYRGYGKELILVFSPPINIGASTEEGRSDMETMWHFTDVLHQHIDKNVASVPEASEKEAETAFDLIRSMQKIRFGIVQNDDRQFVMQKKMVKVLAQEGRYGPLHQLLKDFELELQKRHLNPEVVAPNWRQIIASMLLFIPGFVASLHAWLFFEIGTRVANKTVKKMELYDSVLFGVGICLGMLFDFLGLIFSATLFGLWGLAIFISFRLISIPFADSKTVLQRVWNRIQWRRLKKSQPDAFSTLKNLENKITAHFS